MHFTLDFSTSYFHDYAYQRYYIKKEMKNPPSLKKQQQKTIEIEIMEKTLSTHNVKKAIPNQSPNERIHLATRKSIERKCSIKLR